MPKVKNNILDAIETAEDKIAKAKEVVKRRNRFVTQQSQCVTAISKCNQQIADLLGIDVSSGNIRLSKGNGKKRGPKPGTKKIKQDKLINFVHKAMTPGKVCTVTQIKDKVIKAGYKTHQKNNQNFRSTIGAVVRNDPQIKHGRERGTYILKLAVSKTKDTKKKVPSKTQQVSSKTQQVA